MDLKPKPNHRRYLDIIRSMTPEQRLQKAIELSDLTKRLFRHGLQRANPTLSPDQLHQLYLQRLAKCHNQNY